MGRRLAEATNARFTRRTRGDGCLRRLVLFAVFFEADAFLLAALADGVLPAEALGELVCA